MAVKATLLPRFIDPGNRKYRTKWPVPDQADHFREEPMTAYRPRHNGCRNARRGVPATTLKTAQSVAHRNKADSGSSGAMRLADTRPGTAGFAAAAGIKQFRGVSMA